MGLPLSSVSSSANSSMFFSSRSASRQSSLPRSLADIFCHAPPRSSKALRAALTARSTSAAPASATWVMTSPVAGLMESKVLEVATHSPPIRSLPGSTFVLLATSISFHHKPFFHHRGHRDHRGIKNLKPDSGKTPSRSNHQRKRSKHYKLCFFVCFSSVFSVSSVVNQLLFCCEGCRPLLHVRGQPFLRIFALEQ